MAEELHQIRPAVISDETRTALDEYLRFRHVVRNIYAFEFDPDRLSRLVDRLEPLFRQVQGELEAFADFLEQLPESDDQQQH